MSKLVAKPVEDSFFFAIVRCLQLYMWDLISAGVKHCIAKVINTFHKGVCTKSIFT